MSPRSRRRSPTQPVGPCQAQPTCQRACEGWEPHPTLADVWQTCACGHSRVVHALTLPPPPEPIDPPRCPTCGQLLPKESHVLIER